MAIDPKIRPALILLVAGLVLAAVGWLLGAQGLAFLLFALGGLAAGIGFVTLAWYRVMSVVGRRET